MRQQDDNRGAFPKSVFPASVFPRRIFPWMGGDDEDDNKPATPEWQNQKEDEKDK